MTEICHTLLRISTPDLTRSVHARQRISWREATVALAVFVCVRGLFLGLLRFPPSASDSTEFAEPPSSVVPYSRNYGGQGGATGFRGYSTLLVVLGILQAFCLAKTSSAFLFL